MLKKLAASTLLLFSSLAHAAPLSPSSLPENTRWILHLNLDAFRNTPLWDLFNTHFIQPHQTDLAPKLQGITGVDLPKDLHDVTLYGTAFDEPTACLLINAPIDQPRTLAFLQKAPDFSTTEHNAHTILSWRDKTRDRLVYAAFFTPDPASPTSRAILSTNPKTVALALDTLDAKSPTLKLTSPLNPTPAPATAPATIPAATPILWLAAQNLAELPRTQKVESPLLLQIDDAALALSYNDGISARLSITAKSEKTAQQLLTTAEGFRAMINLSAAADTAPPAARLLASSLQSLSLTTTSKQLTATWTLPLEKIESLTTLLPPTTQKTP